MAVYVSYPPLYVPSFNLDPEAEPVAGVHGVGQPKSIPHDPTTHLLPAAVTCVGKEAHLTSSHRIRDSFLPPD